ncbi:hypothetical protein K440DRAFT_285106 [Wilcoxina mikolae CBS 423.85]|nr:hypothetical protein K440DRAFT_285106 [Wilcoxina mikolae CBS 423.85]
MCASKIECEESAMANIEVTQNEAYHPTTATTITTSSSHPLSASSHNASKTEALPTPPNPQDNSKLQKPLYPGPVAVAASKAESTPDASREATRPVLLSTPVSVSPSFQESPNVTSPRDAPPSSITLTLVQEEVDKQGDDQYSDEYDKGDEELNNEIDDGNSDEDGDADGDRDGDGPNIGYGAGGVVMSKFGPLTDSVASLIIFHPCYAGEHWIPGLQMSLKGSRCAANDIANVDRLFDL